MFALDLPIQQASHFSTLILKKKKFQTLLLISEFFQEQGSFIRKVTSSAKDVSFTSSLSNLNPFVAYFKQYRIFICSWCLRILNLLATTIVIKIIVTFVMLPDPGDKTFISGLHSSYFVQYNWEILYGRHIDQVGQYKRNVCQMFVDSIS